MPNSTYKKGQVVEYKKKFFEGVSEHGNSARPDDFLAKMVYDIFNQPGRTLICTNLLWGLCIILFGLFALRRRA